MLALGIAAAGFADQLKTVAKRLERRRFPISQIKLATERVEAEQGKQPLVEHQVMAEWQSLFAALAGFSCCHDISLSEPLRCQRTSADGKLPQSAGYARAPWAHPCGTGEY